MQLPRYTQEIFERLSKGHYICQNAPQAQERRMYEVCEENFDTLSSYFEPIGFELQSGMGYFYFTKELAQAQVEAKLHTIMNLLDVVEAFLQFDEHFGVAWYGTPVQLANGANDNVAIKERIENIRILNGKTLYQKCEDLFKRLEKEGFMAVEDEYEKRYVVLTSYNYLVDFFKSIKEVHVDESA